MEKEIINQKLRIKCLFFIFLIVLSFASQGQVMQKCPAYPDTIKIAQQENYFLECFIKGDEYFSLITTVDGYPLIENKEGKLEYALIDSTGKINSTGVLAKNKANRTVEEISLLKTIEKKAIEKIKPTSSKMSVKSDLSYSIESFPTSGTRNLLVLLIDFTDLSFQIANNNFINLMNQVDYNETGSFRDYWIESSYSNLTVNSTVRGWYHAANNMAYYGANSGGSDVNPRLLVQEAVDAAENAGLDFSIYDNDNDGNVDGIIVIHSGYGEEAGGGANTIWSHHWTLGSYNRTYDGVTIDDYAIVPELRNNFGSNISNIGVICHEFGHSLGLPDLYDTDASNGDSEGIGEWGLMGSGSWNNNGTSPSNLCAWSKVFLSWANPVVLSSPTSISLPNSAQNNIFYKINTPNANEYFLLENRQLVGFDIGLPGTGLAIWHINTSKTTTSHINANDVNADENLKGVDLEEADGSLDLDNNTNRGDDGDFFPGTSCNVSFSDNTTPNSRTYSPIVNTNKPLANIAILGNNIRFDFNGYNPISGNTIVCSSNAYSITNLPSGCSVVWSLSPHPSAIQLQNNIPSTNQCLVSNPYKYPAVMTLTAKIAINCDTLILTKIIASDTNTTYQTGSYYQQACTAYNNSFPSQSGSLNGSSIFLYPGCMTEVSLSQMTGRTVSFTSGSPQPLSWYYSSSNSKLYLQLPTQSGPYIFSITGDGACYSKTLVFFAYSGYSLLVSPNPTSGETTVSIEETLNEGESLKSGITETGFDYDEEWELEVYDNQQNQKLKVDKVKGKSTTIQTNGWKEGVYIVRVKYKNEILQEKLVVTK